MSKELIANRQATCAFLRNARAQIKRGKCIRYKGCSIYITEEMLKNRKAACAFLRQARVDINRGRRGRVGAF